MPDMAAVRTALASRPTDPGSRGDVPFAPYVRERWGSAAASSNLSAHVRQACTLWGWREGRELRKVKTARGGCPVWMCRKDTLLKAHDAEHP